MGEVWKDIQGFEEYYQISTYGNVRSVSGVCMKQYIIGGHKCVYLYKNQVRKKIYVHRLVAEAFIKKTKKANIVNHKDENGLNNHVDNLEWCTSKYNTNYGTCIARRAENCRKDIEQYTLSGKYVTTWHGIIEAANTLGIDCSTITKVAKGKRASAGGFIWRYKNDSRGNKTKHVNA